MRYRVVIAILYVTLDFFGNAADFHRNEPDSFLPKRKIIGGCRIRFGIHAIKDHTKPELHHAYLSNGETWDADKTKIFQERAFPVLPWRLSSETAKIGMSEFGATKGWQACYSKAVELIQKNSLRDRVLIFKNDVFQSLTPFTIFLTQWEYRDYLTNTSSTGEVDAKSSIKEWKKGLQLREHSGACFYSNDRNFDPYSEEVFLVTRNKQECELATRLYFYLRRRFLSKDPRELSIPSWYWRYFPNESFGEVRINELSSTEAFWKDKIVHYQ